MMMLASSSPLFATEIYPRSSQSKTDFGIDNFYHTLQSILENDQQQQTQDEGQHIHNKKKSRIHRYHYNNKMLRFNQLSKNILQSQQHDAIVTSPYRADKSPVWHNRGVKCTTSIINDTCINSCNDDNKPISWKKGSPNNTIDGTRNLLRSCTSNTILTNGQRRPSIQLSTITEEEE